MPEKRLERTRRIYYPVHPRPKLLRELLKLKVQKRPNSTAAVQWNEREGGMHS